MPEKVVHLRADDVDRVMTALDEVQEQDYSGSAAYSPAEVIDLWERGIFNDSTFVLMALKCDGVMDSKGKDVDIENFIFRWRGVVNPDTGRVKQLTKGKFLKAIATLDDREEISLDFLKSVTILPTPPKPEQLELL